MTIGIADDSNTEIVSGLNLGDIVVTKTIAQSTSTTTSTTPSLLNTIGGNKTNSNRSGGFVPRN